MYNFKRVQKTEWLHKLYDMHDDLEVTRTMQWINEKRIYSTW